MEFAFAKMTPGQVLLVKSLAGDVRWTRTVAGFLSANGTSWLSRFRPELLAISLRRSR